MKKRDRKGKKLKAKSASNRRGDSSSDDSDHVFRGNERHDDSGDNSGSESEQDSCKKRKLSITTNAAIGGIGGYVKMDKNGNYPLKTVSAYMQKPCNHWKCPYNHHTCCMQSPGNPNQCCQLLGRNLQDWATMIVCISKLLLHYY